MAAKVVTVNTAAIRTRAIIDAVTESFIFGVFCPSSDYRVSHVLISIINHVYTPATELHINNPNKHNNRFDQFF